MDDYLILPIDKEHDEYFFLDIERDLFLNSEKNKILILCKADENWRPYTRSTIIKRIIKSQNIKDKNVLNNVYGIDWETSWINLDLWDKGFLYLDFEDNHCDSGEYSMCLDIGKYISENNEKLARKITDLIYDITKHPSYIETSGDILNSLIMRNLNKT
tara:strand:- start:293 stop:769 length:477 start_codon:yes stop_codon:yes gene_type:complete